MIFQITLFRTNILGHLHQNCQRGVLKKWTSLRTSVKCQSKHTICTRVKEPVLLVTFPRGTMVSQLKQFNTKAIKSANTPIPSVSKKSEFKRLLDLAEPEKWTLAGAVLLLMCSSAVTMAVPFSVGRLIDAIYGPSAAAAAAAAGEAEAEAAGAAAERTQRLKWLCGALATVFVVGAVANGGRVYLINMAGQRITRRLRARAFSSLLRQEVGFFEARARTGELSTRLAADASLVGGALTQNLSDGLRSAVMVAAGVSMMFATSPELAMVGLAIVPPVAAFAIVYGRFVRNITKKVQDSLAQATQVAEERLGNMRTVRSLGAEPREALRYERAVGEVLTLAATEAKAKGGFFAMTGLSGNLIILSVLYHGGTLVGAQEITVGALSAFLLYAAYVGVSLGGLSSFYSELNRGLGAGTRLWELLDRKPTIPLEGGVWPSQPPKGDVIFKDVTFAYPTRPLVPVLKNLTLHVPNGKMTAVVGGSGSGKSTLAALLLRFYDPTAGEVVLDGHKLSSLDPRWLRLHIAAVQQEPILFSGTIRENLLYGLPDPLGTGEVPEGADEKIHLALESAQALDFVEKMPQGLNTAVGERGTQLSGGQKQRLAIARALLQNPHVLVLDEATSALDTNTEANVQAALDPLLQGRTVLVIAHRLSTIRSADQIAVLANGRIAEVGTYENLISKPEGFFNQLVAKRSKESSTISVGDQIVSTDNITARVLTDKH